MPPRKRSAASAPEPVLQTRLWADAATDETDTAALTPEPSEPDDWTVSTLTRHLQAAWSADPVLSRPVTVRGELSNVRPSSRGHVYFTLKDDGAALSGVIWASLRRSLKMALDDGMEVLATGRVEIYAPQGSYSLVVSKLEPVGVGALQLAYEQTKARLAAEGLFDPGRKRPLPAFPFRIGIITSRTGAVIHDMLRVLKRKHPRLEVLLYPTAVQGDGAAQQMAEALDELNDPAYGLDLILLARGGGSFEDLFCFSEEALVRAVAASRLPVVTGIGHEPDYSLADAAADVSASTPTAAAERAVPDLSQVADQLEAIRDALALGLQRRVNDAERWLDDTITRLVDGQTARLSRLSDQLAHQQERLQGRIAERLRLAEGQLARQAASLEAVNPLAVLARGFAVPTLADGQVLRSVSQATPGLPFSLRVQDGVISGLVTQTKAET